MVTVTFLRGIHGQERQSCNQPGDVQGLLFMHSLLSGKGIGERYRVELNRNLSLQAGGRQMHSLRKLL